MSSPAARDPPAAGKASVGARCEATVLLGGFQGCAEPHQPANRIGKTTRSSQGPCNANRAGPASRNAGAACEYPCEYPFEYPCEYPCENRNAGAGTARQRLGRSCRFGGRAVQCSSRLLAAGRRPVPKRGYALLWRPTNRQCSTDAAVHFFSRCRNACDRLRPGV